MEGTAKRLRGFSSSSSHSSTQNIQNNEPTDQKNEDIKNTLPSVVLEEELEPKSDIFPTFSLRNKNAEKDNEEKDGRKMKGFKGFGQKTLKIEKNEEEDIITEEVSIEINTEEVKLEVEQETPLNPPKSPQLPSNKISSTPAPSFMPINSDEEIEKKDWKLENEEKELEYEVNLNDDYRPQLRYFNRADEVEQQTVNRRSRSPPPLDNDFGKTNNSFQSKRSNNPISTNNNQNSSNDYQHRRKEPMINQRNNYRNNNANRRSDFRIRGNPIAINTGNLEQNEQLRDGNEGFEVNKLEISLPRKDLASRINKIFLTNDEEELKNFLNSVYGKLIFKILPNEFRRGRNGHPRSFYRNVLSDGSIQSHKTPIVLNPNKFLLGVEKITWIYYGGFRFHGAIEIDLSFKNTNLEEDALGFDAFTIYFSDLQKALQGEIQKEIISEYTTINDYDFIEEPNDYLDPHLYIFSLAMNIKFFGRFISDYRKLSEPNGIDSRIRIDFIT